MKNIFLLSVATLTLAACGNETAESDEYIEESEVMTDMYDEPYKEPEETVTEPTEVTDGVFETDAFTLELKSIDLLESEYQGDGVYVTFDLTNNSDENILPSSVILDHIVITQETDTSLIQLDDFDELEAFQDDDEMYNEMVQRNNETLNELLPGATVEVSNAYDLEDSNLPITISLHESEFDPPISYMEVEL